MSRVIARRFRVRRQLNDTPRSQLRFDPSDSLACAGITKKPASDHLGIGDAHNGVSLCFDVHMSFRSLKLRCPCLPMMTWSCTAMPNTWQALMMALVISTSACEGVGSPDGWLWAITIALAPNSRARLTTSRGRPAYGRWCLAGA